MALPKYILSVATVAISLSAAEQLMLLSSSAEAQEQRYVVKPIAEKKIKQLPPEPLFWRVENFPTLEAAKAAAGKDGWNPDTVTSRPSTALAAECAGKAWLFTLGPMGGSTPGGTKVTEIGPVPSFTAPEYLLRVNHGYGPPGAKTPVHMHPGSEAFYVIDGRLGQRTTHGVSFVAAGQSMNGHEAGMAMEVFNGGTSNLDALIMFVVDATQPFSSPATLEVGH
jgi:quercetin dioxygenase-like cupin family protein